MKTKRNAIKSVKVLITMILFLITSFAGAQVQEVNNSNRQKYKEIGRLAHLPDLTGQQIEQLKEIRLKGLKESQTLRNSIGELRAKLRTLETSDSPQLAEIYQTIDEISKRQTALAKIRAEKKQKIRMVLNEEQRILFDAHQGKQKHRQRKMKRG